MDVICPQNLAKSLVGTGEVSAVLIKRFATFCAAFRRDGGMDTVIEHVSQISPKHLKVLLG
jgi:hypothetical protein